MYNTSVPKIDQVSSLEYPLQLPVEWNNHTGSALHHIDHAPLAVQEWIGCTSFVDPHIVIIQ